LSRECADKAPGVEGRLVSPTLKLADTSRVLIDTVLAAEDHRFFEHGALEWRYSKSQIPEALNFRADKVAEGESPIPQELVKNRLLTSHRTVTREIREAWLATLVDVRGLVRAIWPSISSRVTGRIRTR